MKTNYWMILGMLSASVAGAQVKTNALPEIPPPLVGSVAVNAPVTTITNLAAPKKSATAKPKKKTAAKPAPKISKTFATVSLAPGVATVDANNVNFRGQAGLKGEAMGHLKKGESVTVISQINLDKHAADEPAQWAKIALPASTKVWVNAHFVDSTNKIVAAKKLNLRAGPGENFSVLGVLEKGAAITEITTKGDWTQIEAPTNAFAFVAASYLKQEAVAAIEPAPAVPAPAPVVAAPPVTTNTVAEAEPIIATPAAPATDPATLEKNLLAAMSMNPPAITNATMPETIPAEVETNLPPRIVTHEGWVRPSVSVVAPTYFELFDPGTGNAINYLYTTTTNLKVSRYDGLHIVVTGEEGMDKRWKDTPVLTIQKIYVMSTNAPSAK